MTIPDFNDAPTDEQLGDPGGFDSAPLGTDHDAERMMRRLVAAYERLLDATAKRDVWIGEIVAWYDDATRTDRTIVERLDLLLQAYGISERARTNDDRKTVALPSGEIATTRATKPKVDIVDPKAIIVWAEDSLDGPLFEKVIKTEQTPLVSELRKVVKIVDLPVEDDDDVKLVPTVLDTDGNHVPGVIIVKPETTAKVTPRA